ncbi:hypothetical protein WJX82_007809 [Trebouxia sp. C0006]
MAVFDFEPKDGQLDEPLRSQEIIMLKEVLYVEESDRATSPVAGLHRSVHQQELVPLPSSFGSFEFQFPASQQEQNLEVWRDFEAPHRVMVNLGLRCLEMESDSCYPASMYAAFNPRVITTGVPTKRQHPYRRESSPTESRQTRKMTRSASLGSNLARNPCASASAPAKKEQIELEEVYLLKRNPDSMVIEDTWHAEGPFEGNTLSTPLVWAGTWLIDVLSPVGFMLEMEANTESTEQSLTAEQL